MYNTVPSSVALCGRAVDIISTNEHTTVCNRMPCATSIPASTWRLLRAHCTRHPHPIYRPAQPIIPGPPRPRRRRRPTPTSWTCPMRRTCRDALCAVPAVLFKYHLPLVPLIWGWIVEIVGVLPYACRWFLILCCNISVYVVYLLSPGGSTHVAVRRMYLRRT